MKGMDYMKKKLSLFLAFAVAVTALWGLPVFADGTDGYIAKIGETYYPVESEPLLKTAKTATLYSPQIRVLL